MERRDFLRAGLVAVGAVTTAGSSFWRAVASHAAPVPGPSPYGTLGAPDANGLRLPPGFTSRVLARSGDQVAQTGYRWHILPDGAATFATPDGGWIYTANSEVGGRGGGASSIRFDANGAVVAAYRVLDRTTLNCSGGSTPWGTWLSCEEEDTGLVWECDPLGVRRALPRPALGMFKHEAAVVDPVTGYVYLTEDESEGCFYRFRPDAATLGEPLDDLLETGTLEVAKVEPDRRVTWLPVPFPIPPSYGIVGVPPTRKQVPEATLFRRGEGAWFDAAARTCYFCTTSDDTVWAYDAAAGTIERLYDGSATPGNPLRGADNICVSPGGELFVCEDGGNLEIVLISREGVVAPLLQVTGSAHAGSELAGVAFDPSGTRLYFSSQRGFGAGITYEVTGPFTRA